MASMLIFETDFVDLQEEIKRRDDHAESIRREHFIAAKKIQAWIRGILTRNHHRLLHESAITIQRHWRGYCVRIFADKYLVERVHQMWQDYYDRMATRIQAVWRGYWVRKTVLDIPKMRRWLETVYAKNGQTVEDMKKFRCDEIKYAERAMERESMQWTLFILFKVCKVYPNTWEPNLSLKRVPRLHHLLRTKQQPGVLTRIDKTHYTFIEEMLKCFEFRHYTGKKGTPCCDCKIDPKPSLVFRGTYYERCEREIREMERRLQAGATPVFRSYPYEDQEKISRKSNQTYREASLHNRYRAPSTKRQSTCRSKKKLDLQDPCAGTNELYDKIKKMDCHLDRLRVKCPIHDVVYST